VERVRLTLYLFYTKLKKKIDMLKMFIIVGSIVVLVYFLFRGSQTSKKESFNETRKLSLKSIEPTKKTEPSENITGVGMSEREVKYVLKEIEKYYLAIGVSEKKLTIHIEREEYEKASKVRDKINRFKKAIQINRVKLEQHKKAEDSIL
jgi:FtsZ-interacting cell division protein ZipA